jgi:hypothetical protein
MPMMTTTIKSSMRVNPLLLRDIGSPAAVRKMEAALAVLYHKDSAEPLLQR